MSKDVWYDSLVIIVTVEIVKIGAYGWIILYITYRSSQIEPVREETAFEDFSNIVSTIDVCTVYKVTLSSRVDIAVASTSISSYKEWTKYA